MDSRKWIFVIVVIAVLVIGGGFIIAKGKSSNTAASPSPTMAMSMSPQASATASSSATAQSPTAAAGSVTIANFAFSPAALTVKKGTTVTWTNKDSAGHTVIETDGLSGPMSGTLSNGQSYNFAFNTAGTFHYHCSIHPSMTATVTVTN
jgi:plastocyanin